MKKVLFFTHAESGQSNTMLALALELQARSNVEVHIASFPALSRRVYGLNRAIKFHPLDGQTVAQALSSRGITEETIKHPPLTKSWDFYDRLLVPSLVIWSDGGSFSRLSLAIAGHQGLPFREYAHTHKLQGSDSKGPSRAGCA